MEKRGKHRPHREYSEVKRVLVECELNKCPSCGEQLTRRRPWHTTKTIQTLRGAVFLAGKSKVCENAGCVNRGKPYYASGLCLWSLPYSTYGLDVLAYIGWQHEEEHHQLVEIQKTLNQRGVAVNERNVGKLYRQFLALLSASRETVEGELRGIAQDYGGVIWAIDALEPEGSDRLLYVLYEVQSGKAVAAIQCEPMSEVELLTWLGPYQALPFRVLATLSDGEAALVAALKRCWPDAPHQRCQTHFLNNLSEAVLPDDDTLRKNMRQDLGGLPPVPQQDEKGQTDPGTGTPPLASRRRGTRN